MKETPSLLNHKIQKKSQKDRQKPSECYCFTSIKLKTKICSHCKKKIALFKSIVQETDSLSSSSSLPENVRLPINNDDHDRNGIYFLQNISGFYLCEIPS